MTFSFKPAIRKWASLGLATCVLAGCHQQTQQGTSAAGPGRPASGQVTQGQTAEPGPPGATAAGPTIAGAPAATARPTSTAGGAWAAAAGTTPAKPGPTATAAGSTPTTLDIVVGRNDT